MEGISAVSAMQNVQPTVAAEKVQCEAKLLDKDAPNDKVELSTKKSDLTVEQKQEIMQKAKTKAAGFSILFEGFSVLYYGLRSDKKVAEKFGLDVNKDKKFIKYIKKQQMLWSVPGAFGGLPGVVAWLYNKNADTSKMKVE